MSCLSHVNSSNKFPLVTSDRQTSTHNKIFWNWMICMYFINKRWIFYPLCLKKRASLSRYPKNCLHSFKMYLMELFHFNVVGTFSYSMFNNFTRGFLCDIPTLIEIKKLYLIRVLYVFPHMWIDFFLQWNLRIYNN